MEFENQKLQRIDHIDLSRKGSIDEPILELVNFINSLPNYFTTSSCSGRIIVFESATESANQQHSSQGNLGKPGKKGCNWIFVSHGQVKTSELDQACSKVSGNAVFKFEAMVMHVQCQTLQDAQRMHQAAVASGFRNSGISVGSKGKIIVGIRSTHGLEVPLSKDGALLVSPEFCEFLIECANQKMEENLARIQRFFDNVKLLTKEKEPKQPKGKRAKKATMDASSSPQTENQEDASVRDQRNDGTDSDIVFPDSEEENMSLFMFENT